MLLSGPGGNTRAGPAELLRGPGARSLADGGDQASASQSLVRECAFLVILVLGTHSAGLCLMGASSRGTSAACWASLLPVPKLKGETHRQGSICSPEGGKVGGSAADVSAQPLSSFADKLEK